MILEKEKTITPEWLESKGFYRTNGYSEDDNLPASFDVDFEGNDLCYLEKEIARQQFCIVLTPCQYTTGEIYYRFEVYIQHNIGCGFIRIPNQFTEMTQYHFGLLYEAIRRKKL